VTGMIKKARRMASEFQTHVDEMMKDADLQDVRKSINEIRNFDVRGAVEKAVDPDRSLRSTFDDPIIPPTSYEPSSTPGSVGTAPVTEVTAEPMPPPELTAADLAAEPDLAAPEPPAWVPPELVPPEPPRAAAAPATAPEAPPFVPPAAAQQRQSPLRA
ncbi:MAG: hypothetical protein J0H57_27460, partial [Rhodospirillales bacterium]|nr:hypothetical protein [Rhodospirillales bacterium]